MIRVYLDRDVISKLKCGSPTVEPYIGLKKLLDENRADIIIPYTSAHLSDLVVSVRSEKGKAKIDEDLTYLEYLSQNHNIYYKYKEKQTVCGIYPVRDYFESIKGNQEYLDGGFDYLRSQLANNPFGGFITSLLDLTKFLPSGINQDHLQKIPDEFETIKNTFSKSANNGTFKDLMDDTYNLMDQFRNDPKAYRGVRTSSLDFLKVNKDYSEEDAIKELNETLKASGLNMTFMEFADQNLKLYHKDKPVSTFDVFSNYYNLLDFFGYKRDGKFSNMIRDSYHSYYAAHCDFFVTDDDRTYHKAKTLYALLGIKTVVCKSGEFYAKYIQRVGATFNRKDSLISVIINTIENGRVISQLHDQDFIPTNIYGIEPWAVGYFNRVQVKSADDGVWDILAYKKKENLSDFLFISEIESITNKVVAELGSDYNRRANFNTENETKELNERTWPGRCWASEKNLITLDICDEPLTLRLQILYKR